MRLNDLTNKELHDLLLEITSEFSDRLQKDPTNHADEFVTIRDLELTAGTLGTILERSGKI